jgi:hypothetical protein
MTDNRQIQGGRISALQRQAQGRIRRPVTSQVGSSVAHWGRIVDAMKVQVNAGRAYMVNEPAESYDEAVYTVPDVAGTYVVYVRNDYGFGDGAGTWTERLCVLEADLPDEIVDGRVLGRNFILMTLVVEAFEAVNVITSIRQDWTEGDVKGYAPNYAPEEGPAP